MPLDGTLYEDETLRVLRAAQERIRDPENWCIGNLAQNSIGRPVSATSSVAVKFCALGALQAVGCRAFGSDPGKYLDLAANEAGYEAAPYLNNNTDQPTTHAMFDRAQELRRAEIMETVEAA